MMLREQTNSPMFRRLAWLQRNSWVVSHTTQTFMFLTLVLLSLVSALIIYFVNVGNLAETTCWYPSEFRLIIGQAAVAVAFLVVCCVALWEVSDAYLIKPELATVLLSGVPTLILWGIAQAMSWSGAIEAGTWIQILEVVSIATTIWMPLIASFHFNNLLVRKKLKKAHSYGDSASFSSTSSFEDEFRYVMSDADLLLPLFEKFAISAWAVENLVFSRRVDSFRLIMDITLLRQEASKIITEFILDGSKLEINLDMAMKQDLKSKVDAHNVTTSMFDHAEQQALNLLRYSIFPLWKSSSPLKEVLKKYGAKDIMDLKVVKSSSSRSLPRAHTEEMSISLELEHQN